MPRKQQPLLHDSPEQHGWPVPPQVAHTDPDPLALVHTVPAMQRSESVGPVQQAWPGPPQGEQVPDLQMKPDAHEGVVTPQQGWPWVPHPLQRPARQTPPVSPEAP